MFEGKELEGKIGDVGSYEVDVTEQGVLKIGAQVDIVEFLVKSAEKTGTPYDDFAMAWVKKALGR